MGRGPRDPRHRVARLAAVVLAGLATGGCLQIGDPPKAGMSIANDTDEVLSVATGEVVHFEEHPGETRGPWLPVMTGECMDWRVIAQTSDGVEVARKGPPVCDGDQWTITQDEVDHAREAAGEPAPAETEGASGTAAKLPTP